MMSRKAQRERRAASERLRRSRRITIGIISAILAGLILFMWFTVLRYDTNRLVGKGLPDFSYFDPAGEEHRLSEHREGPFLLAVVRSDCRPCDALVERLQEEIRGEAAMGRVLLLFLQRPDPDKIEEVRRKAYAFPTGFMKVLREAAPLQVVVVPTVYLVVDGRVEAVAYGVPEKVAQVVEAFRHRVSSLPVK